MRRYTSRSEGCNVALSQNVKVNKGASSLARCSCSIFSLAVSKLQNAAPLRLSFAICQHVLGERPKTSGHPDTSASQAAIRP